MYKVLNIFTLHEICGKITVQRAIITQSYTTLLNYERGEVYEARIGNDNQKP